MPSPRVRQLALLVAILAAYVVSLGRTADYGYVWDDVPEIARDPSFDRPLAEGIRLTQVERGATELAGLKGTVSGTLNPGDHKSVRIVLQATSSVTGRVLSAAGTPAPRVTVSLMGTAALDPIQLFEATDDKGAFTFPAVVNGQYRLIVEDPFGPGLAKRLIEAVGTVAVGDIVLDEAAPAIAASTVAMMLRSAPMSEVPERPKRMVSTCSWVSFPRSTDFAKKPSVCRRALVRASSRVS